MTGSKKAWVLGAQWGYGVMKSIAIVGMACRFPGGINSLGDLEKALIGKVNTASDVPADRWSGDWFYSKNEGAAAKAYVRKGNFVDQDFKSFDAAFFDLPPSVAENLDPQQRMLLEVAWEAFENAGIPLSGLAGEHVGVFVGGFMLDHMITNMIPDNSSLINQNTAAGMMMTMLSNRLSHAFDLHGPSLSIDTACSSSLTAFNYACRDIWNGTCDMAMVGGVNSMTRPEYPVGMSKGQFLARDGQCKSFDERGDGYGRGEGAGVVVLKDYDKAVADGDTILAKVLATGANSDGRTPGISMPSGEAQEALIRQVCDTFEIDPRTINYVECHGTGTAIGDPTEAGSIGRVFGDGRSEDDKVLIGTIKSNIGHTEALAGVAGVIKAVLSLKNRVAYPLANLQTPNSKIPFDDLGLRLSDDLIPIGKDGATIRAAVNSFGYGGTNAHAILESVEPQKTESAAAPHNGDLPIMLPISARSDAALKARAAQISGFLKSGAHLDDVLFTAAERAPHLSHRAVVMGESVDDLISALNSFEDGAHEGKVPTNTVPFAGKDEPVFVYTGMGPQWWGMGQELYRTNKLYRDTLDEADAVFMDVAGFSILEEMLKDEGTSQITKTEFAQPANFMVQLGITALLKDAGIKPGAIVGHSVGEVGSAHAAGVLTLRDAMTVSRHRSRTQAKTAGTGTMLAVGMSLEDLRPYLESYGEQIDVAAVNGPSSMTLSGNTVAIHGLADTLTKAEVFNRVLTVEVPYHSHLMDPITDELIEALQDINPSVPTTPLLSTVSGKFVQDVRFDGQYWADNVREPVAFMEAVRVLLKEGYTTFIEIGPQPVLSSALRDCARAAGKDIRLVETLRRGTEKRPARPEPMAIAHAVAGTYNSGAKIDWTRLVPKAGQVMLPNYPWQREVHWLETEIGQAVRIRSNKEPLLGYRYASAMPIWRQEHSNEDLRYLFDHVVTGVSVMPAAGYVEKALELGFSIHEDASGIDVRNIEIKNPLILQADRAQETLTSYDPATSAVTIRSSQAGSSGKGNLHVTADVSPIDAHVAPVTDIGALKSKFHTKADPSDLYSQLDRIGLQYGEAFQPITALMLDPDAGHAIGHLALPESFGEIAGYRLHPSLLDGCFQLLMGILPEGSGMYLPTGFKSIRVLGQKSPRAIWCLGELVSMSSEKIECNLTIMDETGRHFAEIRGMRATSASNRGTKRVNRYGEAANLEENSLVWETSEAVGEVRRLGRWLVFSKAGDAFGSELSEKLEDYGAFEVVEAQVGSEVDLDARPAKIRQGNDADIQSLLDSIGTINGIAVAHGLTAGDESDPTGEFAVETSIALTKALINRDEGTSPLRVYHLTRSAFHVESGDVVNPAQTAFAGFERVARNEASEYNISLIDLPARMTGDIADALVLELLGDMPEDEVALRDRGRYHSLIAPDHSASGSQIDERLIEDATLYRVRGNDDPEAEGMISILDHTLPSVGEDHIRVRVSDISLSSQILTDGSRTNLGASLVPAIGIVEQVGAGVDDLSEGQRIYGYMPADFASHLQGSRNDFFVAPLEASVEAASALEVLSVTAVAQVAARSSGLGEGDTALVLQSDAVASAIGRELSRHGVKTTLIAENGAADHTAVDTAVANNGARFDAIVAPMAEWLGTLGTECLQTGGVLVDSDPSAQTVRITPDVSGIIRTDINVVTGRPARLIAVLRDLANDLANGADPQITGLPASLNDVLYQSFDLPPVDVRVDLEFNIAGHSVPVHKKRETSFKADATYIVTGGLGGFGSKTASWLASNGAGCVVLASRSGANSPAKVAFVEQLTAMGVRVETPQYDLSDAANVQEMVAWVQSELPSLKGVFHSAAVIVDQDISAIDMDVYRQVMRSKANAAWALHEATKDLDLDHFVLYSSIANVVGNRRQAAYSTANGYLDGLAWLRQSQGLPALSVNWGAIGDAGVVAEDKAIEEYLRAIGIAGLSTGEALERLGAYLSAGIPQISAAVMLGWDKWARSEPFGSKSVRFRMILNSINDGANSDVRDQLIEELIPLTEVEREEALSALVAEVIAAELRQSADTLPLDRPINDLGVDSLMAAEIQLVLERDLGISVAVMDLLGGATIRLLTAQAITEFGLNNSKAAE